MTAEIAILNKSAVALAADSAMTIGDGQNAKIYNTVNKIFELSDYQPIALMIYGSLDYMGLPTEVIAKLFRKDVGNETTFDSVRACAEKVIDYLENSISVRQEDVEKNVGRIVLYAFTSTARKVDHAIFQDINQRGKYLPSKLNSIAQRVIKARIEELKLEDAGEPFLPGNLPGILSGHEQMVDALADELFTPLLQVTSQTRELLRRLAKYELHRAPLSVGRTGIVVAGFGKNEICPSLEQFEIDGIISGKLKRRWQEPINIGRESIGADVRAFAQDEMVNRFLKGIDPTYEEYLNNLTATTLKVLAHKILRTISQNSQINIPANAADQVVSDLTQSFRTQSNNTKEKEYKNSILNMVEFIPKQELATFAKALVDLTSLKRRVSAQRETVGGDVDVAVISKSEGLVWISRKHYFPSELNPRFYSRHYGGQEQVQ